MVYKLSIAKGLWAIAQEWDLVDEFPYKKGDYKFEIVYPAK